MKVLLLTPQPPDPPHQGTALRNLQILRGLAAAHEIDLLAFEPADAKSNIPDSLQALCHKVTVVAEPMRSTSRRLWQMTASTKPDMALRLKDPAYESMLKTMLRENAYDIVQIEGIELAWAAQVVRDISPATPLVYDAHNAEALLQSRAGQADWQRISRWHAALYSFIQSRRLAAYEKWICETADWVTCVSEPDQDAIVRLAPRAAGRITVIPNCIDVASYRPPVDLQLDSHQYDVVFSGKMDYRPNVDAVLWFADEIWPRIRAKKPDARWVVAGQRPHARLQRLEGREDITLTGWVPDILPLLWGGVVFVMPFRVGSGTRLKLIEALAAGKGVVSTPVGVEGFPVTNGRELLIAESASDFADNVVRLLEDEPLRSTLSENGLAFAAQYDWHALIPRFDAIYDRLRSNSSNRGMS